MENTPILDRIADNCDNLLPVLKQKKKEAHLTNQEIAAITGVPFDTVRKYFAGESKSPNVYNIMSFCILFGVSLDDVLGNSVPHERLDADEIKNLNLENEKLKIHLDYSKKNVSDLEDVAKVRMKIIYALLGICAVLTILNIIFLIIDRSVPNAGFIQHSNTHPAVFIVYLAITAAIVSMAYVVYRIIKRKRATKETA